MSIPKGQAQSLFLTPEMLRENSFVDANTDEKKISVLILNVQEDYLRVILGVPLYFELLDKISTNTLSGNYLTLVNHYVIPLLIRWCHHDYVLNFSFQLKSKGVTQQGGVNEIPASMADQKQLMDSLRSKAETWSNILIKYLKASMTTNMFPSYTSYVTAEDTPGAIAIKNSNIVLPRRFGVGGYNVLPKDGDCDGCGGPDDWGNRFINLNW